MTEIPDNFMIDPDERLSQRAIMSEIVGNTMETSDRVDEFNKKTVHPIRLKTLKRIAEGKDDEQALLTLCKRSRIVIDDEFLLSFGEGKVLINRDKTKLDYTLVVGNGIGLGAMLPKTANAVEFSFELDLHNPRSAFNGKHGMVGFDTKGRMLYVGKCMSDRVFIAMAPKTFARRTEPRCAAGYSSGPSQMSRRRYRQVVLMMLHFLTKIRERSYMFHQPNIYNYDLDAEEIWWPGVSTAM